MAGAVVWIVMLVLVYALALGSFAPLDLLLGLGVATALVAGLRRALPGTRVSGRALPGRGAALPALVLAVLADITAGTWRVASVVLGLRPLRQPGIVEIPYGDRSPAATLLTAFVSTLSPGEFLVDLDHDREIMLLHILDASDPDAVRDRYAAFRASYERRVVP